MFKKPHIIYPLFAEIPLGSMSLYDFEFRLLPSLVNLCSRGITRPGQIADKKVLELYLAQNSWYIEWDWDRFSCSFRIIADQSVVIYLFPEPEMAPLARFAAGVTSKGDYMTYYTLEMDDTMDRKTWFLCTQSTAQHTLICEVDECANVEEFIALLQRKKIIKKERKSFFSFLRDKFF